MPRGARGLSAIVSLSRIRVVAAALVDAAGQVLIAQRPAGKPLAGRWEFPGGKIATGESREAALSRELREELGVEMLEAEFVMELVHAYPDREVELAFHLVSAFRGEPQSLDGQALRWVPVGRLQDEDILEADLPFIETLQRRMGGAG